MMRPRALRTFRPLQLLWFFPALLLLAAMGPVEARVPVVAAAADLQFALPEVAAAFEHTTGEGVRLAFGSSGNFARQIEQGAPFELFLSADETLVQRLAQAGLTVDDGQIYAHGRLALFVAANSTVAADAELAGLAAALKAGALRRFALPNPVHAPYGQRAETLLRKKGLWEALLPHLVLGENAAQAAQFALSGSVDAGISAWSLSRAPGLDTNARVVLLPAADHAPLIQRMVLLKTAGRTARRFHAYLLGPEAQAVLRRHGFELPASP
ncbi:MAG: molybdate transporter, periplasmic molybdate-binding protein [Pseudomonadota bacterium]